MTWENWYTFFNIKKFLKKKIFPYLPYLAFSDMLPEPHLYFYLALAKNNQLMHRWFVAVFIPRLSFLYFFDGSRH